MDLTQLPAIQQQMLDILYSIHRAHKSPPSFRELAKRLGVGSTNTIDYHAKALERDNLVARDKNKARNLTLTTEYLKLKGHTDQQSHVPLLGVIAAGYPTPVPDAGTSAYEADREMVPLPPTLLRHPDLAKLYALRVKGDSMIDACVLEGDKLIMKQVQDPKNEIKNGDMVVAWLINEELATLKRFYYMYGQVELRPENQHYETIYVEPENVEIRGKVIYVVREVH